MLHGEKYFVYIIAVNIISMYKNIPPNKYFKNKPLGVCDLWQSTLHCTFYKARAQLRENNNKKRINYKVLDKNEFLFI